MYVTIAILGYFVLALLYGLYYSGAVGFVVIQALVAFPVIVICFFYIELMLSIVHQWKNITVVKKIGFVVVFFLYSLTFIFTVGLLYLTYS